MKVLILFSTKYGSTAEVAESVATTIRSNGNDVDVYNLKKPFDGTLEGYDLIILGSGIIAGRWIRGARKFLASHHKTLDSKRLALFICGSEPYFEPHRNDELRKRYLEDIATEHGLQPESMAMFGGVFDFSKYGLVVTKLLTKMGVVKVLEDAGFDASKPCDLRDWEEIGIWASGLV